MSQKAGRTDAKGQLKGLTERKSPDALAYRAAKTAVRAQISLEHAKTRGMTQQALVNTIALHRNQVKMTWAVGAGAGLLALGEALLWFLR